MGQGYGRVFLGYAQKTPIECRVLVQEQTSRQIGEGVATGDPGIQGQVEGTAEMEWDP